MRTSIKSVHAIKGTLLIKTLFACLVLAAFSFATIPASAGDAEDNANKAFADWKAANKAVADAKDALEKARAKQQIEMDKARGRKKKKKKDDAQDKQLEDARADVAAAEAALEKAEAALVAARIALEKAIAELPEGDLKDRLKRERNFPALAAANVARADVKTGGGITAVTFETEQGRVIVNLPDDIMAGDTISGTVVAEPKGTNEDERNRNRGVLNGYVVQIAGQNFPVNKGSVGPMVIRRLQMPRGPGVPPTDNSFFDVFFGVDLSSGPVGPLRIPLQPSGAVITPDPKITPTFNIPPLGQTGRPIVITGPFDGNASNTTLRTTVQDFEKNTENVSGGFGLIAESPRKAIFQSPTNVTGPIEITLNEGSTQTKGTFRNVGVNLTAPKTSLLKGESTELKVEVNGLQGITQPVPLHLVKGGVVTMQGGDVQSMTIKPAEVLSNGTFTTTRTITGVQTGVWNATATVVVFDTCLQDDNSGDLVVYSSVTGDFIFCQGRRNLAGANPTSLSTLNFGGSDFTGGVRVAAGDINDSGGNGPGLVSIGPGASMYRNGALTVADFNYKPGGIHVQLDGFSHTGNAIVQTTKPKQQFTITDRDTRNNTCSCK